MEIYLLKGGQNEGPFSVETVQTMRASGQISATDYVWHADLPEWTMAGEVFPSVERKAPPPMPVQPVGSLQKTDKNGNSCGSCGAESIFEANFCTQCGKRIEITSMPPPVPAASVRNAQAGANKRRGFKWRETIEKHGVIKVIGSCFLILALLGAVANFLSPTKKLENDSHGWSAMTAQEVESLSHFDRRDTGLFQTQARAWANIDVKNGWESGRIVGVPSKIELEDFAVRRWEVFKMSDEFKQLQRPDMDMYAAKDCWVDEYKSFFIYDLRPRIHEARQNSAPAF